MGLERYVRPSMLPPAILIAGPLSFDALLPLPGPLGRCSHGHLGGIRTGIASCGLGTASGSISINFWRRPIAASVAEVLSMVAVEKLQTGWLS